MGIKDFLFNSHSRREIRRLSPLTDKVLALEETFSSLSDEELKAKTPEFRERLKNGETLDDILPEAFAAMREAAWRVLGMKHFRVQVMGGIVLHQGRITEMKTGEGKTLVATLPAYLNALSGKGVHVVTVNDYLAKTQSEWMGKAYRFMGLTVGLVVHGMTPAQKQAAYAADVTYGTNNEFGFDYLRDNMAIYKQNCVQRGHNFAIVDEVDSILIDEARTPLIISGQGDKPTEMYDRANLFASRLTFEKFAELDDKVEHDDESNADVIVDEKAKSATLTKRGVAKAEEFFGVENLMEPENIELQHYINQAVRARGIMHRDIDYVVKDGEVIIVDEFTGRLMYGRRFNEGLHQAIEAKEGVKVARESKTLATITFQNYFRLYSKLSGMTGTALTEQEEFQSIYNLDCLEIPTNKPMIRVDHPDIIYKTAAAKFEAVCDRIEECHAKGQPVLAGTISIETSEKLSRMLSKRGIKHSVLNAKFHEKEAEIIAQAGRLGAVTIATNMAGRGTDIMLGGNAEFMARAELRKREIPEEIIVEATGYADTDNQEILDARKIYEELLAGFKAQIAPEAEKVRAAGGLFIIGTERHESRRIDNQLRGRAGRQGDPGESCFYLSMEDDLMRLFGGERMQNMMNAMKLPDDQPLEVRLLSRSIESAQKKVEGRNFAIRKSVLDFDDVMNRQREVIYSERRKVLDGMDLHANVLSMIENTVNREVDRFVSPEEDHSNWNLTSLREFFRGWLTTDDDLRYEGDELESTQPQDIKDFLFSRAKAIYEAKEKEYGSPIMREIERVILLRCVDREWMDHIDAMDDLKRGMHLRAYGQHNPVTEYRIEGSNMFDDMISRIQENTARNMLTVRIRRESEPKREAVAKVTSESAGGGDKTVKKMPVKKPAKPGRNDPCPCGSGKKYKYCHGANK